MLKAESLIALALMGLSAYFMWHATVLPIWWVEEQGPGGGAFPFWLSLGMGLCAAAIFVRSLGETAETDSFFYGGSLRALASVTVALIVTIALVDFAGAYIALGLFMIWYLRFFGGHGWTLTGLLTGGTLLFLFFFFEVTLKILLPKGFTEPLFLPLYAIFF